MKISELYQLVQQGKKPVVVFGDKLSDHFDESVEPGMMGRIISVSDEYKDENVSSFNIDVESFRKHNESIAKPDWYDKDNNPTKTWFETNFYPKDGIETINLDDALHVDGLLEITKEDSLLSEYAADETNATVSYVEWLENQIQSLRNK